MKTIVVVFVLFLLVGILSCKKDVSGSCEELKSAAATDNVDKVKAIITAYISSLPSTTYSQQNLNRLANQISRCDIQSSIPCFDCIKTLPSQTEIRLEFIYNGSQKQKVVDLSYTASNRIRFVNMHD